MRNRDAIAIEKGADALDEVQHVAERTLGNASLLARLKQETHTSHSDLERRVDLMNNLRTRHSYLQLLEAFYGVHCPLESQIARCASELAAWLPDLEKRMRTALLRLDLRVLGNVSPEILPLASVTPSRSVADQFGCLYVLEGSTLGGQIISREIARQLNYTPEHGCTFFASHGSEIGRMWRKFCTAMESYAAVNPETHEDIIRSATATFRTFSDWFERKA